MPKINSICKFYRKLSSIPSTTTTDRHFRENRFFTQCYVSGSIISLKIHDLLVICKFSHNPEIIVS